MQKYEYKGFWNCESVCGLDRFTGKNQWCGKRVILLTELPENQGTSVTNAIEILASQLSDKDTVLVEHYPDSESYDVVTFATSRFENPQWSFMSKEDFFNNVENTAL